MSDFELTHNGDQACVKLRKRLTASEVPLLQQTLKQELASGINEIIFDMIETASLDSTGIGLLVAVSNSMEAIQGTVHLVNVSPEIMKLLRSMRLVDRLHASVTNKEVSDG